jgi:hypothetical protein
MRAWSWRVVALASPQEKGARMNENLELAPVQVKGTNLRNSLIICGAAIAIYLMFFKKKKRG